MDAIERRTLGRTNAVVTKLGFGTAGIGDLTETLKEDVAQQTLQAAWDGGIRYFDTSPFYGHGKSEHRLGHFLRPQPQSEFVISTKVGHISDPKREPFRREEFPPVLLVRCPLISPMTTAMTASCARLKIVCCISVASVH